MKFYRCDICGTELEITEKNWIPPGWKQALTPWPGTKLERMMAKVFDYCAGCDLLYGNVPEAK